MGGGKEGMQMQPMHPQQMMYGGPRPQVPPGMAAVHMVPQHPAFFQAPVMTPQGALPLFLSCCSRQAWCRSTPRSSRRL